MRLKHVVFAAIALFGAANCRASYADTLKLVSTGGQSVGGVDVYPYNFSLNGSSTSTSMMCINYDDHITINESWQVTGTQLSTTSSSSLQEDAWLFSQVGKGTYSNADIQFAVWYILDPTDVKATAGYDTMAKSLVSQAQNNLPSLTNQFLSQYTVYAPVTTASAMKDWTEGTPQSFIASDPVAVTPEPSSLLLLGTGLCGASLLLMRRRALQEQTHAL